MKGNNGQHLGMTSDNQERYLPLSLTTDMERRAWWPPWGHIQFTVTLSLLARKCLIGLWDIYGSRSTAEGVLPISMLTTLECRDVGVNIGTQESMLKSANRFVPMMSRSALNLSERNITIRLLQ